MLDGILYPYGEVGGVAMSLVLAFRTPDMYPYCYE